MTAMDPMSHIYRQLRRGREEISSRARDAQKALDAKEPEESSAGAHGALYRSGLTLADLRPGECGDVRRLLGSAQTRLRLLEMGLTPGQHVRMVRKAAFGGPVEVVVRGYQLSLRRDEAAVVWLQADEDEDAP